MSNKTPTQQRVLKELEKLYEHYCAKVALQLYDSNIDNMNEFREWLQSTHKEVVEKVNDAFPRKITIGETECEDVTPYYSVVTKVAKEKYGIPTATDQDKVVFHEVAKPEKKKDKRKRVEDVVVQNVDDDEPVSKVVSVEPKKHETRSSITGKSNTIDMSFQRDHPEDEKDLEALYKRVKAALVEYLAVPGVTIPHRAIDRTRFANLFDGFVQKHLSDLATALRYRPYLLHLVVSRHEGQK